MLKFLLFALVYVSIIEIIFHITDFNIKKKLINFPEKQNYVYNLLIKTKQQINKNKKEVS